jgi:hypothetical protein
MWCVIETGDGDSGASIQQMAGLCSLPLKDSVTMGSRSRPAFAKSDDLRIRACIGKEVPDRRGTRPAQG